jgi:hypothetical protein
MSTVLHNTMQHVSLPRFAGAANAPATSAPLEGQSYLASYLFGSSGDEGMDFDLLAEYLLDDAPCGQPSSHSIR